MNYYYIYIYIIFAFKIGFILMALINLLLKVKNKKNTSNTHNTSNRSNKSNTHNNNTNIHKNIIKQKSSSSTFNTLINYWKERFEFIFIFLMSALLIYLFNPRKNRGVLINGETKLLLYLFGFILLITANWKLFIKETKWFQDIQHISGK